MAYVITQKCVATCDTGCVDVCPVDCIVGPVPVEELRRVPTAERGRAFPTLQMFIDPDECICCSACQPVCPADAIARDDDAPAEDLARNARFFARSS
jgi:ferredoxin